LLAAHSRASLFAFRLPISDETDEPLLLFTVEFELVIFTHSSLLGFIVRQRPYEYYYQSDLYIFPKALFENQKLIPMIVFVTCQNI
jgi:hypothetical protein